MSHQGPILTSEAHLRAKSLTRVTMTGALLVAGLVAEDHEAEDHDLLAPEQDPVAAHAAVGARGTTAAHAVAGTPVDIAAHVSTATLGSTAALDLQAVHPLLLALRPLGGIELVTRPAPTDRRWQR